jgi:hypothetical protein
LVQKIGQVSPFSVTTTFPVVAPSGTGTAMLVELQPNGTPVTPLNVTVLVPCDDPKFVPVIVTNEPIVAEVPDRLAILGTWNTVNGTPTDAPFEVVTTTFPLVAPLGTGTVMPVPFQVEGVPAVPLKATLLVPCADPKLTPEIATAVPAGPDVGDRLLMVGVCETVKPTALLATPPTVTTTFPEVAVIGTRTTMLVGPQLVGVPAVPLKVTAPRANSHNTTATAAFWFESEPKNWFQEAAKIVEDCPLIRAVTPAYRGGIRSVGFGRMSILEWQHPT